MAGWTVPGYTESRILGTGGTGRLVEAVQDRGGTSVSILYPDPRLWSDEAFRERFRADAELLSAVDHPNIVRVRELAETATGSAAALITGPIGGTALSAILESSAPLSPEAALAVMRGSLLGVGAAHEAGVVHRDYQPSNVWITSDGMVKLTGFGLAIRTEAMMPAPGTPAYMAPELWEGAAARPASDIYAVTATFYECLTGRVPFAAESVFELQTMHRAAPIPVDDAPSALEPLLLQGLAKTAVERPVDAATFLAELEAAAAVAFGLEWEERGQRELAAVVAGLPDPPAAVATVATATGASAGASARASAGVPAAPVSSEGMGRGTKAGIAVATFAVLGTVAMAVAFNPGKHASAAAGPPGQMVTVPSDAATPGDAGYSPGIAAGGAPRPGAPRTSGTSPSTSETSPTGTTGTTAPLPAPLTTLTAVGQSIPSLNSTASGPGYPSQNPPPTSPPVTPPSSTGGSSTTTNSAPTVSASATMTSSTYSGPCPPTDPPAGTVTFTVSGLTSAGPLAITYHWRVVGGGASGNSGGSGSGEVDARNGTTAPQPFTIVDDPHDQNGLSGTVEITWTAAGTPGGSTSAGSVDITCTPSGGSTSATTA